jgi:hypothetical protein
MSLLENSLNDEITNNFVNKRYFVICQSCYWCLSSLINNEHIASCPLCGTENIERLPISQFENYRFNNDHKRGMVLEFWTEIQNDKPT